MTPRAMEQKGGKKHKNKPGKAKANITHEKIKQGIRTAEMKSEIFIFEEKIRELATAAGKPKQPNFNAGDWKRMRKWATRDDPGSWIPWVIKRLWQKCLWVLVGVDLNSVQCVIDLNELLL